MVTQKEIKIEFLLEGLLKKNFFEGLLKKNFRAAIYEVTRFDSTTADTAVWRKAKEENPSGLSAFYENVARSISPNVYDWFYREMAQEVECSVQNKLYFILRSAFVQEYLKSGGTIQDIESVVKWKVGEDYSLEPFDVSGINPEISDFEITYAWITDNAIEACRNAYEKVCGALANDSEMLDILKDQYKQCLINFFAY